MDDISHKRKFIIPVGNIPEEKQDDEYIKLIVKKFKEDEEFKFSGNTDIFLPTNAK